MLVTVLLTRLVAKFQIFTRGDGMLAARIHVSWLL